MTSRSSSGGRAGSSARSRSSRAPSPNNKVPILIGSGVTIAISLFVVLSRSGKGDAKASEQKTPPSVSSPAKTPAPSVSNLQPATAKAGKTPKTPAPPLSDATLQELDAMLQQVKALRNESVTARQGSGDNQTARAKMSEAHDILEQWQKKVEAPLRWQENAQMDDWAQPAEYVALEKLYATFQRLNNEVRKGGGG